jgi:hypothetical protein
VVRPQSLTPVPVPEAKLVVRCSRYGGPAKNRLDPVEHVVSLSVNLEDISRSTWEALWELYPIRVSENERYRPEQLRSDYHARLLVSVHLGNVTELVERILEYLEHSIIKDILSQHAHYLKKVINWRIHLDRSISAESASNRQEARDNEDTSLPLFHTSPDRDIIPFAPEPRTIPKTPSHPLAPLQFCLS